MIEIGQILEEGKPTRYEVRKVVYYKGRSGRVLLYTAPTMRAAERLAERAKLDEGAQYYKPSIFGTRGGLRW